MEYSHKFLPVSVQIEVDHCGYGIHIDQEEALLISHLGKLQQEGEVLRQELTVGAYSMIQLYKAKSVKHQNHLNKIDMFIYRYQDINAI